MRLASLCGDLTLREQLELPADGHEPPEYVANALAVVVPEVGDRLEVRRQATGQPH
jgi:hypothetical protein